MNRSNLVDYENAYYYYMGTYDHLGYIENENENAGNILLVKDSFSCVVTPYLALSAGKVTWWDMRNGNNIKEYLAKHPEWNDD